MNDKKHPSYEQINVIRDQIQRLYDQRIELTKTQQQQREGETTSGQVPLPIDPVIEIINEQIAALEKEKAQNYEIIQESGQERDWSNAPLYSKSLVRYGLVTPAEQYNTYTTFVGGVVGLGYAGLNFYKAHHLYKLTHCQRGTEEWTYHWARARASPQQIKLASYWIGRFRLRGIAGLGAPLLFGVYLGSKIKEIEKSSLDSK